MRFTRSAWPLMGLSQAAMTGIGGLAPVARPAVVERSVSAWCCRCWPCGSLSGSSRAVVSLPERSRKLHRLLAARPAGDGDRGGHRAGRSLRTASGCWCPTSWPLPRVGLGCDRLGGAPRRPLCRAGCWPGSAPVMIGAAFPMARACGPDPHQLLDPARHADGHCHRAAGAAGDPDAAQPAAARAQPPHPGPGPHRPGDRA